MIRVRCKQGYKAVFHNDAGTDYESLSFGEHSFASSNPSKWELTALQTCCIAKGSYEVLDEDDNLIFILDII